MTEETEHGEHRRAEEEVHGGPAEGAGDGAGAGSAAAPDPVVTTTDAAGNLTVENTGDSPVIWRSPAGQAVHLAARSAVYWKSTSSFGNGGVAFLASHGWVPVVHGWVPVVPSPALSPLDDEGVKVGEIEAWRAWRVNGESLQSLAMDNFWNPGAPMEGNPDDAPQGVYAFKTKERLQDEVSFACQEDPAILAIARKAGSEWINAAYGRVALWGRIVEHDHGYRAEYAKVLSLEGGPCGREKLAELCRAYGLPEPPPLAAAKRPRVSTRAGIVNVVLLAWNVAYAGIMFALGRTRLFEFGVALTVVSGAMACLCFSRRWR